MPLPLVNCEHWFDRRLHRAGGCRLGLYGGEPTTSTCLLRCDRYLRVAPTSDRLKIVLRNRQSPGDIVALTGAVRELVRTHGSLLSIQVDTSCCDIWSHNPYVSVARSPAEYAPRALIVDCEYPGIHRSNQREMHFIEAFAEDLAAKLNLPFSVRSIRGDIYLSDAELATPCRIDKKAARPNMPMWIIIAGGKFDFTAKWWNPSYAQQVVDHFRGRITFVQCGEANHWHPPLQGVVNMIGRTTLREFIHLVYHAEGVVCPVTFAMHAAAAVPTKSGDARSCVVIAGGREPIHWERYPGHHFLHTIGSLPCCSSGGCWRSRCQKLGDGDPKDHLNVCELPIAVSAELAIPRCMHMIDAAAVISAIEECIRPKTGHRAALPHHNHRAQSVHTYSATSDRRQSPGIPRAFAVVSDSNYLSGLMALLNSIYAYHRHDIPVFVFIYGVSDAVCEDLQSSPLGPALHLLQDICSRGRVPGMWEAKQQVLEYLVRRCRNVCLLDADLVLLSRLDDVFELANDGLIVSSQDGYAPLVFDSRYSNYPGDIVGQSQPYFNSGFVCLDIVRHWDLVALWSFASEYAAYSPESDGPLRLAGHGDQGVLNALAAMLNKRAKLYLFPQEEWCNSGQWSPARTVQISRVDGARLQVVNRVTGRPQRILHSSGPKWWTAEGRAHFVRCGDVLRCFEHFESLACANGASHVAQISAVKFVGDLSQQDVGVLARRASHSKAILEFGAGGSTQVFAQCLPIGGKVYTLETDPMWIERTRERLSKLGVAERVQFIRYAEWDPSCMEPVDTVFNDGIDERREEFALRAWPRLSPGGCMLIHDTRRRRDFDNVIRMMSRAFLEVASVSFNHPFNGKTSNTTIIQKKIAEQYENWNVVEQRPLWMTGADPVPESFWKP